MLSASASEAGEDAVELQVQKITLPMPGQPDQATMAKRYAEAEALRRKFGGCKTMAGLAKDAGERQLRRPEVHQARAAFPSRRDRCCSAPRMANAAAAPRRRGIEIYAVCARRAVKADEKQREKAQEELRQKEFEIAGQAPPARSQTGCPHRIPMSAS